MSIHGGEGGRRRIAIVFPARHLLDQAGAAEVLRQQGAALDAARLDRRLVLTAPSFASARVRGERGLACMALARSLGFDDVVVLGARVGLGAVAVRLRAIAEIVRRRHDADADLVLSALTDVAACAPEADRFDAVVLNYLSSGSAADALAPRGRQILVLHDLPTGPLSSRLVAALDPARTTIALNRDDAARIADAGTSRCLVGTPRPAVDIGPAVRSIAEEERFDLLFVGGAQPANVEGLRAFVRGCFAPHLAERGVTLQVAGAVGPAARLPNIRGLTILGRVDDLAAVYARCRVVIVPLLHGTGVSIKTLEAIAHGKPVVSTPIGWRGLAVGAGVALEPPFDERWAARLVRLSTDVEARAVLRTASGIGGAGPTLTEALTDALRSTLGPA